MNSRHSNSFAFCVSASLLMLSLAVWRCRERMTVEARFINALESAPARSFLPRFSGHAFRPFASTRGRAASLSELAAAAMVLSNDEPRDAPRNARVRGVAALVVGNDEVALANLNAAAKSGDKSAWCDIAAAMFIRAERDGDPRLLLDAARAASRGLDGATQSVCRFNFALAMRGLGLIDVARRAFDAVIESETDEAWRAEAVRRRDDLPSTDLVETWKHERETFVREPREEHATRLVAAFPQEARTYAEGIDLSAWAEAFRVGDAAAASKALFQARLVGDALRRRTGESLLADSVAAIDFARTKGDLERGRHLAVGHSLYRDGRIAYRNGVPGVGEVKLREAAREFRAGGSPMELSARYYMSSTIYDQNRISDALRELDRLAAEDLDRRGYFALAAQTGWERGLCLLTRGGYSGALGALMSSRARLEILGERDLVASFDGLIADAMDHIGDDREAWRIRTRALAALSRVKNRHRLGVTLNTAAQAHIGRAEWERALVVLDAVVDEGLDVDDVVLAHALTKRSVVRDRLGDVSGADRDRDDAVLSTASIQDAGYRMRAEAEIELATALLLRRGDPGRALHHATQALAFYRREQPSHLPRILLERGRMYAAQGRSGEARADFDAGLEIIETARLSVTDFNLRAMTLEWSTALYAEAIAAALKAGDDDGAFVLSERARARALLEKIGSEVADPLSAPLSMESITASLADDAAIVEYAETPTSVIAFTLRKRGMAVTVLPSSPERIARVTASLKSGESTAREHAEAVLIAPLRESLSGIARVVFVPSKLMANVPFGVFSESGRADRRLSIARAPSATVAVVSSKRLRKMNGTNMLVVAGDGFDRRAFPGLAPLDHVAAEVGAVAKLQRAPRVLLGENTTRDQVLAELPRADLVHFAGHIDGAGRMAFLVLAERDRLHADEIATLSLAKTRIVVLSACRGLQPGAIDGVADVATAFLAAGVPSVVATTADLDDRVANYLLLRIHEAMVRTDDPSSAIEEVARGPLSAEQRQALGHMIVIGGSKKLLR